MVSIIVSSKKDPIDLNPLKVNIENSIGVKHEIIVEYNNGEFGLCQIYNRAAKKAQYDILCFVHDDVEFLTNNWGKSIAEKLREVKDIGVLGIAGSTYLTKAISSWWQPKILDYEPKRVNIIQKYKHQEKVDEHIYFNPNDEELSAVCSLDGVFLVCRKEVWRATPFDEKLLNGFHGYDMAFCLGMNEGLKNYVLFDILIKHESEGQNCASWYNAIKLVKKKYRKILPMNVDLKVKKKTISEAENFWRIQNESFLNSEPIKSFLKSEIKALFVKVKTLKKFFVQKII